MNTKPFILANERIRLVPLSLDHVDALCAVGLAPELWATTTIRVQSRADMQAYVQRALDQQAAGTALPFAMVEPKGASVIGSTRFHTMAPEHRKLEIGFTFVTPSFQRRGFNRAAKFLMLQHAFETWDCIRVQFMANVTNEKSRAALRAIGATEEAIFRHHRVSPHLGLCDVAVYSIIAAEWPAIRTRLQT